MMFIVPNSVAVGFRETSQQKEETLSSAEFTLVDFRLGLKSKGEGTKRLRGAWHLKRGRDLRTALGTIPKTWKVSYGLLLYVALWYRK